MAGRGTDVNTVLKIAYKNQKNFKKVFLLSSYANGNIWYVPKIECKVGFSIINCETENTQSISFNWSTKKKKDNNKSSLTRSTFFMTKISTLG